MRRVEYFDVISNLFEFKTIMDKKQNEYVVFQSSRLDEVRNIADKTAFEAIENHIHLINNVKKDEFEILVPIGQRLGKALLHNLKFSFPDKHFYVFVSLTLNDSMIIRFHQKWDNEEAYYNPQDFTSTKEKVFLFEA